MTDRHDVDQAHAHAAAGRSPAAGRLRLAVQPPADGTGPRPARRHEQLTDHELVAQLVHLDLELAATSSRIRDALAELDAIAQRRPA